jgi:hypothetical protein
MEEGFTEFLLKKGLGELKEVFVKNNVCLTEENINNC